MIYALIGLAVLIIGGLFVFGMRLRQAGENKVRAEVAVETSEVQQKMDAAGAQASSENVVDRLRKGGF